MDWGKLVAIFERERATANLSRKEWEAVQAKELHKTMSQDRFDDLIKKRTEAGLYYPDEDYPSDPMDSGSKICFNLVV